MPCGRTEWGALEGHPVNQSPCQVLPPHEQRPCVSAVRAGVGGEGGGEGGGRGPGQLVSEI